MTKKNNLIFLAALVCIMLLSIGTVSAATLHVNGTEYSTIGSAVSAASDGDTIIVSDGLYVEWVSVSTSNLTICSENGSDTTSWTGVASDVLMLNGVSNVTIDGFRIFNAMNSAVTLSNADNCTIINNLIDATSIGDGILISTSNSNTIANNIITGNSYGIRLIGICDDNILTENTIYENTYGILDSATLITNLISNTILNNTEYDVFFDIPSANNVITDLILTNNSSRISTVIPASMSTSTYFKGLETSTAFPEMTNINGYISINRTSDVDLNVSFSYDESDLDSVAESDISLYWLNDTTWTAVEGATLNTTNNNVSATLTGFSDNVYVTFGLFANTIIIPSAPEGFTNTTGDDWIKHSWTADASGKTSSYNISIGESWINGTTDNFYNHTGLSAHAWSNITVYAYNATDSTLSDGTIDNVQMPNNVVTILDITGITVTEGETITFDINSSDADGDTPTFACNNSSLFDSFNTETGEGSWITDLTDAGTYSVEFNVTDGYGSIDTITITITVNDFTLSAPTLSNSTGNFFVDWTWDAVENADSYNVSLNNIWYNGTTDLEINDTPMNAHATSTIQVLAYNETYGVLSDAASDSVTLANNPISISGLENIAVNESELISINAGYSDLDEDTATFSCNRTDLFTDFNTSTGEGTWQTNYTSSGTYSVEFTVSDGVESTATQVITITVTNAPATFYVGSSGYDYTNIYEAINDAADGDTIIVTDGTYTENLIVDKEVIIRSENGAESTIIVPGLPFMSIVEITANNVTIDGFNTSGAISSNGIYVNGKSNCTILNNIVTGNNYGIFIAGSENTTINNNNVNNNLDYGILIGLTSDTLISDNLVTDNGGHGIGIGPAFNITVSDNTINTNGIHGISISGSANNTLSGNTVNENTLNGIHLDASNYNILTNNIVNNNVLTGIHLESSNYGTLESNTANNNDYGITLAASTDTTFTANTAINNSIQNFIVYGINEINDLAITENSTQISLISGDTEISFTENTTINTTPSGKLYINGYLDVECTDEFSGSIAEIAPDSNFTISYDDSGMSSTGESSVALYKYNSSDSTWTVVSGTTLDTTNNQILAPLSEGTFGLFKSPEPTTTTTTSSSHSSGGTGGSLAIVSSSSTTPATTTTTTLTTNDEGEITADTVAESQDSTTTLTLYEGTIGTDSSGNPVSAITVSTPASMPADTPEEVLKSGHYYDFGPSGTTFNHDVLITIGFDPNEYNGKSPIIYTHSEENGWTALKTTVDWENGIATAYTNHFSLYALFGDSVADAIEETTTQVSAESSVTTTEEDVPEENSGSGIIYWLLGAGIVLVGGVAIAKYQKDKEE